MRSLGATSAAHPYWASGVAVFAINLLVYLLYAVKQGTFALPANVVAIAAALYLPVSVTAGFVTKGLLSGDWTPPVLPTLMRRG